MFATPWDWSHRYTKTEEHTVIRSIRLTPYRIATKTINSRKFQLCKSTMNTPGSCWVHLRTHNTAMSCWHSPVTALRAKSPWQRQTVHCWPQSTSVTKASSPWWSSSGRTAATGGASRQNNPCHYNIVWLRFASTTCCQIWCSHPIDNCMRSQVTCCSIVQMFVSQLPADCCI